MITTKTLVAGILLLGLSSISQGGPINSVSRAGPDSDLDLSLYTPDSSRGYHVSNFVIQASPIASLAASAVSTGVAARVSKVQRMATRGGLEPGPEPARLGPRREEVALSTAGMSSMVVVNRPEVVPKAKAPLFPRPATVIVAMLPTSLLPPQSQILTRICQSEHLYRKAEFPE